MTANNGPDSDLIFSLGMVFAAGRAQPLIAAGQPPPAPAGHWSQHTGFQGFWGAGELLQTSPLMSQDFMMCNRQEAFIGDL